MLKILLVILGVVGLWSFNVSAEENDFVEVDEVIEVVDNAADSAEVIKEDAEQTVAEVDAIKAEAEETIAEVQEAAQEQVAEIENTANAEAEAVVETLEENLKAGENANLDIDVAVAEVKANEMVKGMSDSIKKLNLSAEQLQKVKELNEISSQKQKQLLDSVSWIREQANQLENLTVEAFRDILTDDQKVIFEEMRANGFESK